MVIAQGDIFWTRLSRSATGSGPGSKRPVVVVQRDSINRSKFNTVYVGIRRRRACVKKVPGQDVTQSYTKGHKEKKTIETNLN